MELAELVDTNPSRAAEAGARFGVSVRTSIRACSNYDAAIIATPLTALADNCLLALQNEAFVLVEKPLAIRRDALSRFQRIEHKARERIQLGYQMRFHPSVCTSSRPQSLVFRRVESHFENVWALVLDCGVHDIDLAAYLLGSRIKIDVVVNRPSGLSVKGQTDDGRKVCWHWSLGAESERTLELDGSVIDFRADSVDLLAVQLEHFRRFMGTTDSCAAKLSDAHEVIRLLEAIGQAPRNV